MEHLCLITEFIKGPLNILRTVMMIIGLNYCTCKTCDILVAGNCLSCCHSGYCTEGLAVKNFNSFDGSGILENLSSTIGLKTFLN